jgi:hypothetical protein
MRPRALFGTTSSPCAFFAAALAMLVAAPIARAQETSPRDTSMNGYLEAMSDSTDRYFGLSAAPVDTAGLDTAIVEAKERRRLELSITPAFDFSRVDGAVVGAGASVGEAARERGAIGWGKLSGLIERATGPGTMLGGGRYENRLWVAGQPIDLTIRGGRETSLLDRDETGRALPMLRALFLGTDWMPFVRRDGWSAALAHRHGGWWADAGWRDALERPLAATTTWNVFGRGLEQPFNLPAARGRNRELELHAGLRGSSYGADLSWFDSSHRLGSDFEYQRTRAAAGLDLSLGRAASLVPQIAYGRLAGDAAPQACFYVGGDAASRTFHGDERSGTRFAAAKLELISAGDVLAMLHLPHSAAFPLQGTIYGASCAVWGRDPYTGALASGRNWPERRAWASEAGVSLVYASPVFFGEGRFLRVAYAWPIGPDGRVPRAGVSISQAFDLLGPQPKSEE